MSNVKNYFEQAGSGDDNTLNLNGTWKIDGVEVTATATQLNNIEGKEERFIVLACKQSFKCSFVK
jgi:hypothetical protein